MIVILDSANSAIQKIKVPQFSEELPPLHVQCTGHMTPCLAGTVFSGVIETPGVMLVCWYCTCTWQIQSVLDTDSSIRCSEVWWSVHNYRLHWGEQLSAGVRTSVKCEEKEQCFYRECDGRKQVASTQSRSHTKNIITVNHLHHSRSQCSVILIPHSESRKHLV